LSGSRRIATSFSAAGACVVGGIVGGGGPTSGIGASGGTVGLKSAMSPGFVCGVSRRSSVAPSSST
jgi:hypothetical protein